MPRRSNDFQRLIALLHRTLVPAGATVTESNMVRDSAGQLREADVTIEYRMASYAIMVAIECRDHKRPATVEWIEQLSAKYAQTKVSKVVAVSRAGFAKTALNRASQYGIEALTLGAATDMKWVAYIKSRQPMQLTMAELHPTDVTFYVADSSSSSQLLPAAPNENTVLFEPNGVPIGTVVDIYNTIAVSGSFDHAYLTNPSFRMDGRRELVVDLLPGVYVLPGPFVRRGVSRIVFGVALSSETVSLAPEAKSFNDIPVAVATANSPSWSAAYAQSMERRALSVNSTTNQPGPYVVSFYEEVPSPPETK